MKANMTLFAWCVLAAIVAPPFPARSQSNQFAVLHHFNSSDSDGIQSGGDLALGPDGSTMYGTSYSGGYNGYGALFSLGPDGQGGFTYQTLYSFTGGTNDGGNPDGGLTWYSNAFWGTTQTGGSNGFGTIFSFNPDPTNTTKQHFAGNHQKGPNGRGNYHHKHPDGGLYGSCEGTSSAPGEVYNYDAVGRKISDVVQFSQSVNGAHPSGTPAVGDVSPSGQARPEGASPLGSSNSVLSQIALYGVTTSGGSNNWGTVFTVQADTNGFNVLHNFGFFSDGGSPIGGMVLSGDVLYGTASAGGSNYNGTIFMIHTDGSNFKVLAAFNYATTGDSPQGDLILSGKTLYGTTYIGGTGGGGTVFSIDTNGDNFTVLYSFSSPMSNGSGSYTNSDGGWLVSGLLWSGYTLYGVTPYGGAYGGGTAFAIALPAPPSLNIALSGGNLSVSWPASASNYLFQVNSDLGTSNWSKFLGTVNSDGTNNRASMTPGPGNAFFRLLSTNGP
jgi:uncharacterized repeat protein (TIGR03803 family)